MLEEARRAAPRATFVQGDGLALPFPNDAFDRLFTGHFYGHLEVPERERFLAEARRVARELVVVDASKEHSGIDEQMSQRELNDGSTWEVYKRYFTGAGLAAELGGGEILFEGAYFVVVRALLDADLVRCANQVRELPPARRLPLAGVAASATSGRCRACVDAGYPLESLPVLAPLGRQRAYLFGQAPGVVEGEERRPWRGRAGKTLRRWLELDEDAFYETFYCASVTRCYPGRPSSGRGDRTPTPEEQRLCEYWRDHELRLLAPKLIVTVGGLAARRLLGVRSVTESVGARYEHDGAVAIPLPHPSGASSWLNAPANRARVAEAVALIHRELAVLGAGGPATLNP